jgi:MFS transporter, DHA2 family, multidrug resistance protein
VITAQDELARQYTDLIHRNGGATSVPALGALQLFQNNVITQSPLLSYIDIYFGLATLGVVALISIAVTKTKPKLGQHHFHPWQITNAFLSPQNLSPAGPAIQ